MGAVALGDSSRIQVAAIFLWTSLQTSAASMSQHRNESLRLYRALLHRNERVINVKGVSRSLQVSQGSLIFETDNDQQVSSWTTEIKECINNR